MRALLIIGVILLALGIASLFVAIPKKEKTGISVAGTEIGVETRHSERIPTAASIALIVGGVVLAAAGARRRA